MMALLLLYSKHGNNLRILSATIIPAALLGTLKSHTLSFYYHHKTKPHLFPLYFWKKCWELTTLTLLLENQTTNWWWPWVFDVLNWILVLLNLSWALRQQPQRMSASFKATTPPAPQQHNARCPSLPCFPQSQFCVRWATMPFGFVFWFFKISSNPSPRSPYTEECAGSKPQTICDLD